MECFTFKAGAEYLGIQVQYIFRVLEDISITQVARTPESYLGLIYYRGELYDVIDIVHLLGHGNADLKKNFRIILVKWSDKKLALVTDEIIGLFWIDNAEDNKTVIRKETYTVHLITPEEIWEKLLNLSYGPR